MSDQYPDIAFACKMEAEKHQTVSADDRWRKRLFSIAADEIERLRKEIQEQSEAHADVTRDAAMLYNMADLAGEGESAGERTIRGLQETIDDLRERVRVLEKHELRLKAMMPIFQEARDALCAISVPSMRSHNISPSLADRMDAVGIQTRWDAAIRENP